MKLFTKTVCPKCMLVKTMMDAKGIEYETVNIDNDEQHRQEIIDKGFMSVPILFHEGQYYTDVKDITRIVGEFE